MTLINHLTNPFNQQSMVSIRRIEGYLGDLDVSTVPMQDDDAAKHIAFKSATTTWPQDTPSNRSASANESMPRRKFLLTDLNIYFPSGELSLVCGKLGSGKTLLLLCKRLIFSALICDVDCPTI